MLGAGSGGGSETSGGGTNAGAAAARLVESGFGAGVGGFSGGSGFTSSMILTSTGG
jgi:hypothetical protein